MLNPLVQQASEIEDDLGDETYEKAVRAGVNIGLSFQEAVEKIEGQADADCRTDYETPNIPHLEEPHEPARGLAYFVEEKAEISNQGISAGILASAYFEEQ
jgi:hypothetical protein